MMNYTNFYFIYIIFIFISILFIKKFSTGVHAICPCPYLILISNLVPRDLFAK